MHGNRLFYIYTSFSYIHAVIWAYQPLCFGEYLWVVTTFVVTEPSLTMKMNGHFYADHTMLFEN